MQSDREMGSELAAHAYSVHTNNLIGFKALFFNKYLRSNISSRYLSLRIYSQCKGFAKT
jgi:hypothetical protein